MFGKVKVLILGIVLTAVLIFIPITINAYQTSIFNVELIIDGVSKNYSTNSVTVEEFLEKQKVVLSEYDIINFALNDEIKDGMIIEVEKAIPVSIVLDGQENLVMTCADTVEQLLEEKYVVIKSKDQINVSGDTSVYSNMQIVIDTYNEVVLTEVSEIEFTVERIKTSDLEEGTERVIQNGVNGEVVKKYKVIYSGGVQVAKEYIDEKVIEPVNTIIEYGFPENGIELPNGKIIRYSKVLDLTATAYSPYEPGLTDYTYTGLRAVHGVVAVDPTVIPLHTMVYIEGYGVAIAADIGKSIKGNRIDLCFESLVEMTNFGVRDIKVYILE